jgi:SET domain-containing protein
MSQGQPMQVASYLSPKTVVKQSSIAGRGLHAAVSIARSEVVSVKGGHLIDRATRERNRAVINDADMQVTDELFLAPLTEEEFGSVMMFLNHCCEPNVGVQGQIVFVALRDVAAGEELTIDYGTIDHDAEPLECHCGAACCRVTITGEDWRLPDLQRRYGDHFAWHLLRRMRAGL